jgi:tetratricopeptide (TPR) repeat protein
LDFKLPGSDPLEVAPRKLALTLETKSYRQVVPDGTSSICGSPVYISALGYAYAASGEKDKARKSLEELRELSKRRYVSPYWIAMLYAGLGDSDKAFEWLEMAYTEKSGGMVWLQAESQWDTIRSDPRFQDLMRRIGLPR